MAKEIRVPALFDPHGHLRDDQNGDRDVVRDLLRLSHEGGIDIIGPMPNPERGALIAEEDVRRYINYLQSQRPDDVPIRLYPEYLQLNEFTTAEMIDVCRAIGIRDAKIYPLHRTTNSSFGVRDYAKLTPLCRHAGRSGMRVHVHPEHPNMLIENRDAEYQFIPIMDMLLRATEDTETVFVWEHGTDSRCIPFWKEWAQTGRFYVTLTAHHLATNESDTFGDVGAACKPPIKTRFDGHNLRSLVAEDHVWVMAGGDGAAHPKEKKHVIGKCACGAFTNPFMMQLYAHALSELLGSKNGRITFTRFTSGNATRLYGPPVQRTLTLRHEPFTIPNEYTVGTWTVEPFWAGQTIDFSLDA